jgi:hypothetical protein
MSHNRSIRFLVTLALLVVVALAMTSGARAASLDGKYLNQTPARSDLSPNATVFATGLNNPRGLKFGPDGSLYVAEGGTGGTNSTVGKCDQVPGPIGPYTGSKTGARISKIDSSGKLTTVADNLPSSQTTAQAGGFVSGVGDIAFIGNTLYSVLSGAGCSHGVPDVPNALIKVNADGTTSQVSDLGAFLKANPVKRPNPPDFEPDGTWYSLIAAGSDLYAIEPNHGELDKLTTDGKISRVVDISDSQGHIVPTAMAMGSDGNFYVGNLSEFPASKTAKILKITPAGQISVRAQGLTAVLGVAFDAQGQLYALETSAPVTQPGPPVTPGTGRVVRIKSDGSLEPDATGLTFPTAMTFGPDGKLYVSNNGFGFPAGKGEIVRIDTSVSIPSTAPTTGGSYDALSTAWLALIAGVLFIAVGWLARRRSVRS